MTNDIERRDIVLSGGTAILTPSDPRITALVRLIARVAAERDYAAAQGSKGQRVANPNMED